MKSITEKLLEMIADYTGAFKGAYNIREDAACAGRQSSEHIHITSKEDMPGLDIHVDPGTKGETVFIPACVTHGDVDDLVYNDFFIGKDADITVVAGCGVNTDDEGEARHNGIHRFFLEENAQVLYKEKHIGTGKGNGVKTINPVTDVTLKSGAVLTMDTTQISGVDKTLRKTNAVLADHAKLVIRERLLTDGDEEAKTEFEVVLDGEDSGADIVSRSVAKGNSVQDYVSCIVGKNRCTGHSECDAILAENGKVNAAPKLSAFHTDAQLIHEAAIGKIAGEQIMKLKTLGLTEEEAEKKIIEGFLK